MNTALKSARVVLIVVLCVMVLGCSKTNTKQVSSSPDVKSTKIDIAQNKSIAPMTNEFGFRLYSKIAGSEFKKNIFISPVSVELALAMTFNGASGTTKDAMSKALGYDKMSIESVNSSNKNLMASLMQPEKGIELDVANSLWCGDRYAFNPDFISTNKGYYSAEIRTLDLNPLEAAKSINAWVSDKTRKNIKEIVGSNDIKNAMLVLVNAVYFKGKWLTEFPKANTKQGSFTLLDASSKNVQYMRLSDKFTYIENDKFQAVNLPYKKGTDGVPSASMYIFLPRINYPWKQFISEMTGTNWKSWTGQMEQAKLNMREGTVILPKFKLEYETILNSSLIQLGLGEAFDPVKANFSGMFKSNIPPLYISKVIHKSTLDIDEKGTEASAATVVVGMPGGPVLPASVPFVMRIDHPFFVAIVDEKTGRLLFLGSVVEP